MILTNNKKEKLTITPSELKRNVEETGSVFFSRSSMKFFGDTMKNYGCRMAFINTGNTPVHAWELYRKRPVKHGLKDSAYFDQSTFERIFPKI